MFEDYKKDLRDLFQKFHDDGVFESLYDQLSHGNHYINVKCSTTWDESTDLFKRIEIVYNLLILSWEVQGRSFLLLNRISQPYSHVYHSF